MTDFNDYLDECMQDAEFKKKEYEALAVEYEIKQAMIDARKEKKPYSKKRTIRTYGYTTKSY